MCERDKLYLRLGFVLLLLLAGILSASPESIASAQASTKLEALLSTLSDEANGLVLDSQALKERVLNLEAILKDSEMKIAALELRLEKSATIIDEQSKKLERLSKELTESRTEVSGLKDSLKRSEESLSNLQDSLIIKGILLGGGCLAVGVLIGSIVF